MGRKSVTVLPQTQAILEQLGEQIGVAIKCQKEEIFEKMHRI